MLVDIFDVGHGQCAVAIAPNGRLLMLDCGARVRDNRFWTPALHYFGQTIETLALLNLDEDHIKNFGPMLDHCRVRWVVSNPSIGLAELRALKGETLGPGAAAVARWMAAPKIGAAAPPSEFGAMAVRYYWNAYVYGGSNSTNDLSLAAVLQYGAFRIMFAGDLEAKGWDGVLRDPAFRDDIANTNIFVASHHGRESGCCEDLFKLFRPQLVIISDDERQHATQDTDAWYRARCHGAPLVLDPTQRRYVMTTRSDGSMRLAVAPDGRWRLWPWRAPDWPIDPVPLQPRLGLASLAFR